MSSIVEMLMVIINEVRIMKTGKRAVAFLDILGFKDMLLNKPLDVLSSEYEKLITQAEAFNKPMQIGGNNPSLFPTHTVGQRWCVRNAFSDSIILVSEDESLESVLKLLVYSWRLLQFAIASGMPFRGGIAYDQFYLNEEMNIYLGKALTDAYLLESAQQWIGVSIENNLINSFPELKEALNREDSLLGYIFPKYSVPYKNGST
jgi:hypothetical protein